MAAEIRWAWSLFARDMNIAWREAADEEERSSYLLIAEEQEVGAAVERKADDSFHSSTSPVGQPDVLLSAAFRKQYLSGAFSADVVMPVEPLIRTQSGDADALSTAFYLVNSLQEYRNPARDQYGRFPFSASLQARFDCARRNLVGEYFERLYNELQTRFAWPTRPSAPSRVMLSHDMDLLFRAWREDGKFALSKGRVDQFAALLWRQISGRPDWLNVRDLMEADARHGMPGVFFWIPRKSRRGEQPPDADYSLNDKRVLRAMRSIAEQPGFELGMHSSAHGLLAQEKAAFPFAVRINRQHFLRFRLPDFYQELERAGFELDASLGFAEQPGFRNSYALPFQPWSLSERRPFRFTECPLHLMDATFHHYLPLTGELSQRDDLGGQRDGRSGSGQETDRAKMAALGGQAFLEQHQRGALISLLWHNNYLSNGSYRHFKPVWDIWLKTCERLNIQGIDLDGILDLYGPHRGAAGNA